MTASVNNPLVDETPPAVIGRTARLELDIAGMTCAGCAVRLEKVLGGLTGVAAADVNFALERAVIQVADRDAAPSGIGPDVIAAVEQAGYRAQPRNGLGPASDDPDARKKHAEHDHSGTSVRALVPLLVAAALTVPLVAQMVSMTAGLSFHLSPTVELALATPVQFWAGAGFYRAAWRAARSAAGNMDLLVALGTSAAYFYSLALVALHGDGAAGHLYFEASAVVITLVLAGRWLEARAKRGTTAAIRELMALRPQTARVERDGAIQEVPIGQVRSGNVVVVYSGERVPVDGRIATGETELDESLITGESLPVVRGPGEAVTGGAINGSGLVRITATAVGEDSTLARIIRLVEAAQAGKAPIQRLVDRISGVFVPIVLVIALTAFFGWLAIGGTFEQAVVAAVSVLVVACPCALGLATPTAIVAGTGMAARAGILFRDVEALERAHQAGTVVFDKTGTLTEGRPQVVEVWAYGIDERELVALAAAAQTGSGHPLAIAIVDHARAHGIPHKTALQVRNYAGAGIVGEVGDRKVAIGNRALMQRLGVAITSIDEALCAMEARGVTPMIVSIDGRLGGLIGAADPARASSAAAIASLDRQGIDTVMLSGDAHSVAEQMAGRLGITRVMAPVRPEGKARAVEDLKGRKRTVVMVGDGINDAPALASADVGIAMGSGTDVAMETAGVTLMRSDPRLVAEALSVSRATWRKIQQNLFWAFAYNIVAIPLAAFGLLTPAIAGAAMAMSSLSVVGNTLLLRRWRPADADRDMRENQR